MVGQSVADVVATGIADDATRLNPVPHLSIPAPYPGDRAHRSTCRDGSDNTEVLARPPADVHRGECLTGAGVGPLCLGC